MNVCGLSNMSDSQTSVFFQHVIHNLKVFGTCCVFVASWTMLILDTVSPTLELGSQLFTTLYRRALSLNVVSASSWIALSDIPVRNKYFITAHFFKFIHIYIIFYRCEYRLLNFVINQHQNDVICINQMNCLLVVAVNLIYTQNFPVRLETFGTTLMLY